MKLMKPQSNTAVVILGNVRQRVERLIDKTSNVRVSSSKVAILARARSVLDSKRKM